jgi:thymidylate synthase
MNNLDKQYLTLLQDILDNGVKKETRNGGTVSLFGRQIRHKMSEGFPLLTTKKMPFKIIATELLWFLRGDTNIKYLVDNGCNIWNGDCYKKYDKFCIDVKWMEPIEKELNGEVYNMGRKYTKEAFINKIKTDEVFAKTWGDLGPIYGKQWRSWGRSNVTNYDLKDVKGADQYKIIKAIENGEDVTKYGVKIEYQNNSIDQILILINDLKTNPDSRRLMVNAWNVGELDQMVLPPCHYGFQVYTRELTTKERLKIWISRCTDDDYKQQLEEAFNDWDNPNWAHGVFETDMDDAEIPTRTISLMWNQRSVDTFLGLPFNIASYGLLLEIIAKSVNMVPDELIGNLGDVHLYLNHVDQAKEQIGRELDLDERREMVTQEMFNQIYTAGDSSTLSHSEINQWNVPTRTREPYTLPTLNINTEFWPHGAGESEGILDALTIFNNFKNDNFCKCLLEEDLQLYNYQSSPSIKAQLSN